jgi:hypothetical protein
VCAHAPGSLRASVPPPPPPVLSGGPLSPYAARRSAADNVMWKKGCCRCCSRMLPNAAGHRATAVTNQVAILYGCITIYLTVRGCVWSFCLFLLSLPGQTYCHLSMLCRPPAGAECCRPPRHCCHKSGCNPLRMHNIYLTVRGCMWFFCLLLTSPNQIYCHPRQCFAGLLLMLASQLR